MALTLGRRCSPVHPTGVRRPPQSGRWFPTRQPTTAEHRVMGRTWPRPPPHAITRRRTRCQSHRRDEGGRPSSHAPIRAERPTLDSHALPPGRNETVRPRDRARSRPLRQRPLNRETPGNRPAPLTPPQQTTDHPEQPIERDNHNSQTNPEENDARVDDEPFHHEAHGTSVSVTTTRKPAPGPYTTRVVERARERNTVAERHFQSDLSGWMGRLICCR